MNDHLKSEIAAFHVAKHGDSPAITRVLHLESEDPGFPAETPLIHLEVP